MSVLETTDTAAPVLVRADGPAARITLNRPDQRNALSLELMAEATAALERLGTDRSARAIVIEAAGPAFCAGHDLREMVGRDLPFYQRLFDACSELMEAVHRAPQPVIARVHGTATAAGCQLVAACDLAVAAEEARFATPGVKIGLFCSTPMVPLSRAIGRKRALEMLLTSTASCRATRSTPPSMSWSPRSRARAASRSGSASARSTTRSTSTSRAPTTSWAP
jgi:enoyl-CoA hydratase/carnithine racemase